MGRRHGGGSYSTAHHSGGRRTTNTPGAAYSTYVNGAGTSGPQPITTQLVANAPSPITTGNILYAVVWADAGGTGWSGPAGWTKRGESADSFVTVWTKTAGGSEPSTYTWNWTTAGFTGGIILQYRPASAGGTDTGFAFFTSGSSSTWSAPSVTPTVATDLWIIFMQDFNNSNTPAVPSVFTARDSFALAGHRAGFAYEKALSGTGATGASPSTNLAGATDFYVSGSFLVKP
jgi:hypothetical protein